MPVRVGLSGSGIEFIIGKQSQDIGHLDGLATAGRGYGFTQGSTRKKNLEWVIKAQEGTTIEIAARSERAGAAISQVILD